MPRNTASLLRNGEVGCSSKSPSTIPFLSSYQSSACRQTSTEDASSVASSAGLNHGTNALAFRATSAIAGSSVETRMSQMSGHPTAKSMLHTIRGFPPRRRMFFPGSRFDPPRAVMRARILKFQPSIGQETHAEFSSQPLHSSPDGTDIQTHFRAQ